MSFTPEQITEIKGQWWIKCVKAGGHTLSGYGQKVFAEDEEIGAQAGGQPIRQVGDFFLLSTRRAAKHRKREGTQTPGIGIHLAAGDPTN